MLVEGKKMNLREGVRRSALTLAYITAICICIKGVFLSMQIANTRENIVFTGWAITLIASYVTGVVCYTIVMWITDGFLDIKKEEEIPNNTDEK